MKILVTGGTGYIGSHTIVDLINNGFDVVSVDSFINSDGSALDGIEKITGKRIKNYQVDLRDKEKTRRIFDENPDIEGVIHFAALKAVGESVEKPLLYFDNNINSLLNILDNIVKNGVKYFVFSSSCTVYGSPDKLPVDENTPVKEAESPYGRTKQVSEMISKDVLQNTGVKAIMLRYFNPAGAHESAKMGESPALPPLNLVPIITETAIGKRESMMVFGDDYDTRDGSAIRDYIHVMDLADAHTKSLQYLINNPDAPKYDFFNLGIGQGVTVLEAINAFEKVTGQKLNYSIAGRRPGDIPAIYADYSKAKKLLNWNPKRNIEDIMRTAWEWEKVRSKEG